MLPVRVEDSCIQCRVDLYHTSSKSFLKVSGMFDKSIIIGMASDHAGFELKEYIKGLLLANGYKVKDYGTHSEESVDYPDFAHPLASDISGNRLQTGILICGTGIGIGIAANKVKGIRCATCSEPYSAKLSKMHNNSNILSFGARVVGVELAKMIVDSWLEAEFEGGRHAQRVQMIQDIENDETFMNK